MKILKVNLKERGYNIYIDSDNLAGLASNLKRHVSGKILVITNTTIFDLYKHYLEEILFQLDYKIAMVPDSEDAKSLQELEKLYTIAIEFGLDRTSTIIAFGGGVIGDLAGFLAATLYRGINFIQIPTTLLAQVDSSVGGKVAVNHIYGKNLIGAFYQPKAVLIDTNFLKTLPERELKCGLAEVLKYAFIKDKTFFEYLASHCDGVFSLRQDVIETIIAISCRLKAEIVAADEKEANVRALLNFGHTFGHALEKIIGYGVIKHGEAVAIGMALALKVALNLKILKEQDYHAMIDLITQYNLPHEIPNDIKIENIVNAMLNDKKNENNTITLVLATQIGEAVVQKGYSKEKVLELLA